MPVRSNSQKIGDIGEGLLQGKIDQHRNWIARSQSKDYGIDLEAEFAPSLDEGQIAVGQLLKLQCKTRTKYRVGRGHVSVRLDREFLDYAGNFKIPVILAAVCLSSRSMWWLWIQEWLFLNEERFASDKGQSLSVKIPIRQTLDIGLDFELPQIARGAGSSAMVIALRDVFASAIGWEHAEVADELFQLLSRIKGDNAVWAIRKITDGLIGAGGSSRADASQFLPGLLALVRNAGDTFTRDQVLRLVLRPRSFSETGFTALSALYTAWPEHTRSLGLPHAFAEAGARKVAWYAAIRERYPEETASDIFGQKLRNVPNGDLSYAGLELVFTADVEDWIGRKWMNRGDTVLLDCLTDIANRPSA